MCAKTTMLQLQKHLSTWQYCRSHVLVPVALLFGNTKFLSRFFFSRLFLYLWQSHISWYYLSCQREITILIQTISALFYCIMFSLSSRVGFCPIHMAKSRSIPCFAGLLLPIEYTCNDILPCDKEDPINHIFYILEDTMHQKVQSRLTKITCLRITVLAPTSHPPIFSSLVLKLK